MTPLETPQQLGCVRVEPEQASLIQMQKGSEIAWFLSKMDQEIKFDESFLGEWCLYILIL